MKYNDLLTARDSGDLQALLDALAVYWLSIPKVERPKTDLGKLADDVLSYRRRLDRIPQEQIDILWKSTRYLVEKLADMDPNEVVEQRHVKRPDNILENGRYWVFPKTGEFVECDNHAEFASNNQDLFIESLGIDGWRFMHAVSSRAGSLMQLLLSAGGIICEISGTGPKRIARYQVSQISLPWLKHRIGRMALRRSVIRVYDPAKPYRGPDTGIMFILGK